MSSLLNHVVEGCRAIRNLFVEDPTTQPPAAAAAEPSVKKTEQAALAVIQTSQTTTSAAAAPIPTIIVPMPEPSPFDKMKASADAVAMKNDASAASLLISDPGIVKELSLRSSKLVVPAKASVCDEIDEISLSTEKLNINEFVCSLLLEKINLKELLEGDGFKIPLSSSDFEKIKEKIETYYGVTKEDFIVLHKYLFSDSYIRGTQRRVFSDKPVAPEVLLQAVKESRIQAFLSRILNVKNKEKFIKMERLLNSQRPEPGKAAAAETVSSTFMMDDVAVGAKCFLCGETIKSGEGIIVGTQNYNINAFFYKLLTTFNTSFDKEQPLPIEWPYKRIADYYGITVDKLKSLLNSEIKDGMRDSCRRFNIKITNEMLSKNIVQERINVFEYCTIKNHKDEFIKMKGNPTLPSMSINY